MTQGSPKKNNITPSAITLKNLFFEFLKIGTIGFGGGLVVIGIIQNLFVNKKKVISPDEFIVGTSLSQFIGAFAVNTTYYIGRKTKGIIGGIISVVSFLLPSFLAVIVLTYIYLHHNEIIETKFIIGNVMPVIVAVLITTSIKFFLHYKSIPLITVITCLITIPFLLLLENYITSILVGGLIYSVLMSLMSKTPTQEKNNISLNTIFPYLEFYIPSATVSKAIITWFATPTLFKLSVICLGIGIVFFGGGYSLAPLIQHIFVQKLKWISNDAFVMGMIISQITPGPFAVIATFIGYYLYGFTGAIISTTLVFMPSLMIMEALINFYDLYQKKTWIRNFVQGIGIVVGLMILKLSLNFTLEFMWLPSLFEVILFIVTLIILIFGYSPAFPIIGALVYSLLYHFFSKLL